VGDKWVISGCLVVPTVQAHCSTCAIGTPGRAWRLAAQGKTPAAKKGTVHVAKIMAATAVEAIKEPSSIARAKADLAAAHEGSALCVADPKDAKPPLDMAGRRRRERAAVHRLMAVTLRACEFIRLLRFWPL
jgi:hypothetical protein